MNEPANKPQPSSLQECSSLRAEIGSYSTQIASMMFWSMAGTSGLLTIAVTQKLWFFALFPIFFIVPCAIHHNSARLNIIRIASYLRVFGGADFQYENRLRKLRGTTTIEFGPSQARLRTVHPDNLRISEVADGEKPSPPLCQPVDFWCDFTLATSLIFAVAVMLCVLTSAFLLWRDLSEKGIGLGLLAFPVLILIGLILAWEIYWKSKQFTPGEKLDNDFEIAWRLMVESGSPTENPPHSEKT